MNTPILSVKNLSKHFYGGKKSVLKAVDDISFEIRKGETFGLVGESGCGKTTTGRTIIRLYKPTSGEVFFNGKRIDGRITKEELKAVTSKMQMIFQDPVASLNPRMTVEEIVCEGAKINKLFSTKEELRANMERMLDLVGLTKEHATRYPHEFSGGQRQRICIARALITNPNLIIADEPISSLDVSIQAQILNLLNELRKELSLTILFIAHDLSVVKYFSERIAVMSKGVIVETAESEKLYANPIHPYTKSLLSAIPIPDPVVERKRVRVPYDYSAHGYSDVNKPSMREVSEGHFVMLSDDEYRRVKNGENL
ncbi:MAG: ATP-binding cassette domain-containing protein [Clostridiales bacterium]|jgi:ABC-type oligopeptide transport system ATPase subunit|nr:ATP-binding cassette domain-containing protein [Clostridiales bacterium]